MTPRIFSILIIFILIACVGLWFYWQKQKTKKLRSRFGPEYDRALEQTGDRSKAETILTERKKRVERLDLHPLAPTARERFAKEWRVCQARFVDDPRGAVKEGDHLVMEVMETRGYPMADFEQRAADISVDHPRVVETYRAAHEIAIREQNGEASTEDLRQAMVYYRTLFEELLGIREPMLTEVK